ncbi:unnamed protein product [Orchesella dallaii]|uniref:Uncharacterized protein n=1 Tax=Orchesella dallaii TaxID=48710 RepID=A0ABP1PSN2_9HEXA
MGFEEEFDGDTKNITLLESYFRYNVKLRGSCYIYMLYTSTFNETTTAIHESGFGTSDEVLFFIQLQTLAEWEDHVEKFSALHQHSSFVFHANVVFMDLNSSYVGVHCYFCPPNPNKLQLINITSFQSYLHLKYFARKLNSNGHGRHAVAKSSIGDLSIADCLKIDPHFENRNRHKFYHHLRKHCSPPAATIYIAVMRVVNMSIITQERDLPEVELDDLDWFIQFRYGESMLQRVPNEIVKTRGSIAIMQKFSLQLVTCVTIQSLSKQLNYVFVTVIHESTWFALLALLLIYVMLYRSFCRGIDTIWALFSKPCFLSHPRKLICFHWIGMVFVSSIYGSDISSESLLLPKFPLYATLFQKGYKVWIPQKQYLTKFAGPYEKAILVDVFSTVLGRSSLGAGNYQSRFEKLQDFLYDGNGSLGGIHSLPFQNLSKFIDNLTTLRLFTFSPWLVHSLGNAAISEEVMMIGNTQLCKVFNLNDVNTMNTIRIWSYLSYRFSYLLNKFLEVGIPTRFEKMQIDLNQDAVRKLKITATGACLPPKPIALKSAVGVSILVLYVVGTILLIINFHGLVIHVFKFLLNFIRKFLKWLFTDKNAVTYYN